VIHLLHICNFYTAIVRRTFSLTLLSNQNLQTPLLARELCVRNVSVRIASLAQSLHHCAPHICLSRVPTRYWKYWKNIVMWNRFWRPWKSIEFRKILHKVLKKYFISKLRLWFFTVDYSSADVFALSSMNKISKNEAKWSY